MWTKTPIYHLSAASNAVVFLDARVSWHDLKDLSAALLRFYRKADFSFRPEIFGILTLFGPYLRADFWNPDGTREHVCCNALRCIPRLFWEHPSRGIHNKLSLAVQTTHGEFETFYREPGDFGMSIAEQAISVERVERGSWLIDVGTPHRVTVVGDLFGVEVEKSGKLWSTQENPVNATFVVCTEDEILVRTFERGVGETQSCGSGAICAFIACRPEDCKSALIRFTSDQTLTVRRDSMKNAITLAGKCIHKDTLFVSMGAKELRLLNTMTPLAT